MGGGDGTQEKGESSHRSLATSLLPCPMLLVPPTLPHTERSQLTPGSYHLQSSDKHHEVVTPLTVPILHHHCPHLLKEPLEPGPPCLQPLQGLVVQTMGACLLGVQVLGP